MQEIINKIQNGEITDNQLLQALSSYNDQQVDEYNEIVELMEKQSQKLEEQGHALETQHQALLKTREDRRIYIANEESLKKQSVAFQIENKKLEHQISVLRKEAKTAKEQIKRNKSAIAARDAKIKKLEKSNPSNKETTKMGELNCVYSKGKDVLLVYPSLLTLGVDGEKKEQVSLLYTDRSGSFITAFLDNNNEVAFSHFINQDAEISDRTRSLIHKNCIKISEEAGKFAETWLYKVNVMQNKVIQPIDLTCHKD